MNKSFKRVLLLLAVVCMVCALFTAVAETSAAECVHSYKTVQTFKVGDCETKGIYKKQCTECGDVQYISELGHKMVESYVDADCDNPTRVGSVCAVCDWYDEASLKPVANSQKLGHDLKEVVVESNCEHAGGVMGICTRCDHWEMVYVDPADPQKNHDWKPYSKEPTCTEVGYAEGNVKCALCQKIVANGGGKAVTLPVDPTNHTNVVVDEVLQHGNCLAGTYDVVTLVCKDCGASCGRESRVAAHDWDKEILKQVTCGKDGLENWVCKVCGLEKLEEVILATGEHVYKDMPIPADCETPEKYGSVCTVCDAVKGTPVTVVGSQPLGHDWVEDLITTDDDCLYEKDAIVGHCSRCEKTTLLAGNARPAGSRLHVRVVIPAVAPTCSTPGWTEGSYCFKCGDINIKPVVVPALGKVAAGADHSKHDNLVETVVYTAVDCDSDGLSKFVCTACGWTETKVVDADHKWVDTVIKAATCVADGFKNRECSVCGVKEWNVKIDKTGVHNYEEYTIEATCENNKEYGIKCTMCGEHQLDKKGNKIKFTVEDSTLPHKYETTVFVSEENCIYLIGTTYEICSLCGHENPVATTREDGRYYRDAQHHNWVNIADVDATCVTPGFTGKKICSRCYKVEVAVDGGETPIDPIYGHDFIFVVSKEASCKDNITGQGKKVCQLCGYTDGKYYDITVLMRKKSALPASM